MCSSILNLFNGELFLHCVYEGPVWVAMGNTNDREKVHFHLTLSKINYILSKLSIFKIDYCQKYYIQTLSFLALVEFHKFDKVNTPTPVTLTLISEWSIIWLSILFHLRVKSLHFVVFCKLKANKNIWCKQYT